MKKTAAIFLVFVYAFSTTGVALKADYCCNNLKSVKLILADGVKDKEGCCGVKYESFKVKDAHAAADILTTPCCPISFVHALNFYLQINEWIYESNIRFANIHAPPLHSTTPVYLSNCVFRI